MIGRIGLALTALALAGAAGAQDMSKFTDGPAITGYGKVAKVDYDLPIPKGAVFKVILDVNAAAKPGEANRGFDSAARFINMHVAAGVPERNIKVVVIVHGPASGDLGNAAFYGAHHDGAAVRRLWTGVHFAVQRGGRAAAGEKDEDSHDHPGRLHGHDLLTGG